MKPPGTSNSYYKTNQSNMSTINNPSTENCWSEAPVPSSSRVHREPFAPMTMNGNDSYPRYVNKKNESTSYHGFSDETYFTPLEVNSYSNHDGSIKRELLDNAWNDDYTDHNDHMDNYYHNTMERGPAQNGEFSPLPMIQEQFYGNEEGGYVDENMPVYHELDNGKQQVVLENTPYQKATNTASMVRYTDHMDNIYDNTMGTVPNGQFDSDPVQMYQHNYVGNDEEGYVEEGLPVYQELSNGEQHDEFQYVPYRETDNTVNSVMPSKYLPTTVSSTIAPTRNCSKRQLYHVSDSRRADDIDTIKLCENIKLELKERSIPQHVFAKKVLGRSQGTLSDLLKHPKPFHTLKPCGKLTFRRMHKWMSQPLEKRLAILDGKRDEESEEPSTSEEPAPKRSRRMFTDVQRDTLQNLFEQEQRPSIEVQREMANHLGLDYLQVNNFFMNSRRRFGRKPVRAKQQTNE